MSPQTTSNPSPAGEVSILPIRQTLETIRDQLQQLAGQCEGSAILQEYLLETRKIVLWALPFTEPSLVPETEDDAIAAFDRR